ncbi:MAG TPA: alpha/beta hydrolase [Acidothermaceae bacterium]|jgi:pimeloyl-ACP methyl ester carboxylesterase
MTTFVLVHGAWHGGWCWQRLNNELAARGHHGIGMDLPIDDPTAGAAAYADAAVAAFREVDEGGADVIVVGHSLGGTAVPMVARAIRARRMVFLTALMPTPGRSLAQLAAESPESHTQAYLEYAKSIIVYPDGATNWNVPDAAEVFYHDCDAADAQQFARRFRRQYPMAFEEISPLTEWPDIPSSAVVATRDRVLSSSWLAAEFTRRTGDEAIEIPTGHSPMCAQPATVADLFDTFARI